MILSYSHTSFVPAIIQNTKIHTLRRDENDRWKAGMSIQHWFGNPRNSKSSIPPFQFHEGVCDDFERIIVFKDEYAYGYSCYVFRPDGSSLFLTPQACLSLATNDGLTPKEFHDWFLAEEGEFSGKIIHFTPFRYA